MGGEKSTGTMQGKVLSKEILSCLWSHDLK
jgi:hypothetical protein